MIVFENDGEIDPRAIGTFGVNVKEGDDPIGFFGTGLKYAIAVCLRLGCKIEAQSGETEIQFFTMPETIRGKEFRIVNMQYGTVRERMAFTLELGKNWQLWMAYRELACNCRDENGDAHLAHERPAPEAGKTRLIVTGDEFAAVHGERWNYILEDEPDFVFDDLEVRARPSHHFYYRGIRVSGLPRHALFTYNDRRKVELTEDRTAKDNNLLPWRISRALMSATDEHFIRQVLTAPDNTLESAFDFHGWGVEPSPMFLKTVGDLVSDRVSKVNDTALRLWKDKNRATFTPREIELTAVQRLTLERALGFCEKIGFRLSDAYPIVPVEALGTDTLGLAADGKIFIAERAFQMGGTKQVAATLIEEFLHLKHGYEDCTRSMQNYLFEKLVSIGEELVGEPL